MDFPVKGEYENDIGVDESLLPFGSAATIHCETIRQEVSLDWRKNLQSAPQDERIEMEGTPDGYEHSLAIYCVRKSDEGEYGVVIKDSYTALTKITVIGELSKMCNQTFDNFF